MVKNLLQGKHEELNVTSKNAGEKARPGSMLFWEVEGAEPWGYTGQLAHHRRQIPSQGETLLQATTKNVVGVLCLTSGTQNCTLVTVRHRYIGASTWTKEKLKKKTGKLLSKSLFLCLQTNTTLILNQRSFSL